MDKQIESELKLYGTILGDIIPEGKFLLIVENSTGVHFVTNSSNAVPMAEKFISGIKKSNKSKNN